MVEVRSSLRQYTGLSLKIAVPNDTMIRNIRPHTNAAVPLDNWECSEPDGGTLNGNWKADYCSWPSRQVPILRP